MGQLLGVQFDWQSQATRGRKDAPDLRR